MYKKFILGLVTFAVMLCCSLNIYAQSAPITIDGVYDDWTSDLATFIDPTESISGIDLLEMQVSNDADFLFIRFKTDAEFDLTTNLIMQGLTLYIDTDNDPTTGFQIQNGYGAELSVYFRERFAYFNVTPTSTVSFADFNMRPAPTVTSKEFEIAIGRDVFPDGVHPLFTSSTIRLLFQESISGDSMPNQNEVFSYTFDETPVSPLVPTEIIKDNPNFIRIIAYNTLFSGLNDSDRIDNFENIISILNPDIIGFSECGSTSTSYVKILLDQWLPLGNSDGWFVLNDSSSDLITASRWPFLDSWNSLYRQFPVLVDLPENYQTDLLFTNSHLRCCDANYERQEQVDEYVSFMMDAKTSGGNITLPENTPFVYAGDLNLVGYAQQLTTLITGDIQNTGAYGEGELYDWDATEVTDQICVQSDKRMAYTWRNDYSSYPTGRLDFMIFSDAVMTAEKSFTVQTEVMPTNRLQEYGFNQYDTSSASDHFPVVTDFSINAAIAITDTETAHFSLYPNPASDTINLNFMDDENYLFLLYNAQGNLVLKRENIRTSVAVNVDFLASGIYFVEVIASHGRQIRQKVIIE